MAVHHRAVLPDLCSLLDRPRQEAEGDLLRRYVGAGDERAFAELLHRHGPMVLGLCRRVVGDYHAAEDVFQATFLTLARRACSIRRPESLAAWLHGIAFRLAVRARRSRRQARAREAQIPPRSTPDPLDELTAREVLTILDRELDALPENHRLPVILCCLEGLSQEEAARRLGWSAGAVKGRLERGRERLRRRLRQRGLTLPGAMGGLLAAGGAQAAVPATLARATVQAVVTGGAASPAALALMQGALRTLALGRLRTVAAVAVLLGVLGVGAGMQMLPSGPVEQEPAAPAGPERRDDHGDPLPDGAVLRLGTVQRRAVGATLAFRADGKSFLSVRGGRLVRSWDAATGRLQESRALPAGIGLPSGIWEAVALSPDGRWLVQDASWQALYVWDLQTGKRVREITTLQQTSFSGGQVRRVAFSPDGKQLAAVGYEGQKTLVRVWDRATGKELFATDLDAVRAPAGELVFSPDGTRLVLSFGSAGAGPPGPTGGTYCWDVAAGRLLWHNKEFVAPTPVFTHDGEVLSSSVQLPALDLATGKPVKPVALPAFDMDDRLSTTPDGKVLFVGRADRVVVWDLVRGREVCTLAGARGDLLPSPDGKFLITNDGVLQRWDLASGKPAYPDSLAQGHGDEVSHVVFSADGRRLASASRDGTVGLWDATTGKALRIWQAHAASQAQRSWFARQRAGVRSLDLTPDGRWLLSAGVAPQAALPAAPPLHWPAGAGADQLKLWDTATGQEVRSLPLPDPGQGEGALSVFHARIAPDGTTGTVLFGDLRGASRAPLPPGQVTPPTNTLAQWDRTTGRLLRRHAVTWTEPVSTTLAPDGKRLVAKGVLLDGESGKELLRLEGVQEHRDMPAVPYTFSADGLLVAGDLARLTQEANGPVIGSDGVRVWEAATGKVLARLKTESWVAQVAFHPNPRYLAINDLDGIRLWDILAAQVVWTRPLPEEVRSSNTFGSYAGCLAFSPDGRRLATGLPDSTLLVWDVPVPPQRPEPLAAGELASLQDDLGGAGVARAWRAVWRLADFPNEALPVLRARLKPVQPAPADTTRPLLEDLDSDSFERREAATKRLLELGPRAEAAVRDALQADSSAEKRRRLETILNQAGQPTSGTALWEHRAVAVLERIGSAEARQVVAELARGMPSAPLTQQAKAALGRMR